jgi:Big-like domain-containing protein
MIAAFTTSLALFAAPSAASAANPVCFGVQLTTRPATPLTLPADMRCDDVGVAPTVTVTDGPANGSVTGSPLVYTPNAGFTGGDSFGYTLKNNDSGLTSARAVATIIVNTPPSCSGATVKTPPDTPLHIAFTAFPCKDAEGQSVLIHTYDPALGMLDDDFVTGEVVYTPPPGFTGTDTFDYYGSDGIQQTGTFTMTVTVAPTPAATATPTPTPVTQGSQPPPPTAKDTTAPIGSLKSGTASVAKGIALTLTSNEAGSAKLTATVDKATARKLKLDRKAKGPVTVGTGTAKLVAGKPGKLTLKLTAKAKSAFKRAAKVKLLLTAVIKDAAGNVITKKLTVTLRR